MDEIDDSLNILPMDEHNGKLIQAVHPPGWVNPEPAGRYNLVVIGAGTAGLVAAAGAAGLGARVALIERGLMGGDCLNTGCVPSKSLIRAGRAAFDAREARRFGALIDGDLKVDFAAAMQRMREVRSRISFNDSARRFKDLGVDVFIGKGEFTGQDEVRVGDKKLRFKKAVIATGARAVAPPIEGLAEVGYLTNETVFNLTERPAKLAVIGAGPIGSELAQAFQRLGSKVIIIERGPRLLEREDPDAAKILKNAFQREGIEMVFDASIVKVTAEGGRKFIHLSQPGQDRIVNADENLVGAGRAPNIEGLGLENIGVEHGRSGIKVDDNLRTTNPRVYAAGDVAMKMKFTHAADFAARLALQNALFKGRKKLSSLVIPWTTYTDPEIAHVGMNEDAARSAGMEIETYRKDLSDVDRAIADGEEDGFVKIHVKKRTDKIVGATIVARHAGEMIGEITVAMAGDVGLGKLAGAIHPYPTQAEAIRQIGDMYNRKRLTPAVAWAFKKWLEWTR